MKFSDSKSALNWMINNPLKKLYVDEYGNYVIWGPYSNVVEYWYYIGGEDEGYDPWDFDRLSPDKFIEQFDNEILSTD
jgi:hypothetical protein